MSKEEFDFSDGKQGAVSSVSSTKTRITIRLDNHVLNYFRQQAHDSGGGNYQTLINDALKHYIKEEEGNLERTLRRVIREELNSAA